jgi:hypothetical protein
MVTAFKKIPYSEAADRIEDASVLLYRPWLRPASIIIAMVGRTRYSHGAMAARWGEDVMCLEQLQTTGGRATCFKEQVERSWGRWDVYRVVPGPKPFDAAKAVQAMRRLTGTPYGWWSLIGVTLRHTPFLRLFFPTSMNDQANGKHRWRFCSDAVSWALRVGGFDPVPNLADRATEPGDLARSSGLEYVFTPIPDPK